MRPAHILSSALLCTSVAASWQWTDNTLGAALDVLLPHKRAPQAVTLGSDDAPTPNPTQTVNTDDSTTKATGTTGTADQTDTAKATTGTGAKGATQTTGTGKTGSATGSNSKASQTTFDPRLPPGGLSMITPNPRSSTQYYKIGNYITFAWNYTSLSVTPSAIDILASCSQNSRTYTLALNQSVAGATGAFTWDTNGYQATATQALLTETYTLIIHDAQKDVTAAPSAGYLSVFNSFTFGMYSPQPYTPLDQYVCVTCSGALSSLERQSMLTLGVMATAAVLGATWFTTGLSLA